jgi:3D (Asp-Asp-Asp) domain-containing protein
METGVSHRERRFVVVGSFLKRWLGRAVLFAFLLVPQQSAESDPIQSFNIVPLHSAPMEFEATAYCDLGITKSGVPVAPGIVAADPAVLPLGSLILLETTSYRGIYHVLDTGGLVKGRIIDIFMPGLEEALTFGRQKVRLVVLRYGYPKPRSFSLTD